LYCTVACIGLNRNIEEIYNCPYLKITDITDMVLFVVLEVSPLFPINSGVLQGSVLGPMLYLLFTSDLPQTPNITIGTFADDIVILTCHNYILRAFSCLT
jgi:hypothetical protein